LSAWEHYIPLDTALMHDLDAPPRGVCEQGYWVFTSELESRARAVTLSSYFESRRADLFNLAQGRLFTRPNADLSDTERTKAWADRHFNEPCGILSETVEEPTVGLIKGLRGGVMGYGLVLASSPGIEAYRDWTAVYHVVLLSPLYRTWVWDD
jgi:hypothetical protein